MKIENYRVTAADNERDKVLKTMSKDGYTLVAVTDDGSGQGRDRLRIWSLYFTKAK